MGWSQMLPLVSSSSSSSFLSSLCSFSYISIRLSLSHPKPFVWVYGFLSRTQTARRLFSSIDAKISIQLIPTLGHQIITLSIYQMEGTQPIRKICIWLVLALAPCGSMTLEMTYAQLFHGLVGLLPWKVKQVGYPRSIIGAWLIETLIC